MLLLVEMLLLMAHHSLLITSSLCFLNQYIRAVRTGHRAVNHQQIVFRINGDNSQVLDRLALVAHVAGHLSAFKDARRISRCANAAGRAVKHRAMRGASAVKAMTLHESCKPSTFRLADHFDQ